MTGEEGRRAGEKDRRNGERGRKRKRERERKKESGGGREAWEGTGEGKGGRKQGLIQRQGVARLEPRPEPWQHRKIRKCTHRTEIGKPQLAHTAL